MQFFFQVERQISGASYSLRLTVVEMVESWAWYPGGNNLVLSQPVVAKGKASVPRQGLRFSRGSESRLLTA